MQTKRIKKNCLSEYFPVIYYTFYEKEKSYNSLVSNNKGVYSTGRIEKWGNSQK